MKSARHYTETAIDEIRLLDIIKSTDPHDRNAGKIVRLLHHFDIHGINGTHKCLVFEALGCNLYKLLVKNGQSGLHLNLVKSITRQVLQGLDYLHRKCHIIHTDIKPENILLVMGDVFQNMIDQLDDLKFPLVNGRTIIISAFINRASYLIVASFLQVRKVMTKQTLTKKSWK